MRTPFSFLAYLILIYCIWNSNSLLQTWGQTSYYENYGWILLILWCLPIVYYWTVSKKAEEKFHHFNPILLALALFFSILGTLGDLHVFQHVGLAFILAAFIPWSLVNIIWMMASFLWMPASSWIASHVALDYIAFVFPFRLLILSIVTLGMILKLHYCRW
jgi:hypothetical protein